jgi:ankyrin repeat protein/predicted Ser/Thr protein kinase
VGLDKTEPGVDPETTLGVPSQPAPEPAELAADFPQLEILELLGQGGMGVVYKARQKSLDRLVALKILAVPDSAGPDFAERFSREARALASLSHPSIVTVHDFGRSGDRYYLLMEYVDGTDLHQLIRGGEIQPQQALELVSHLCDALQFAHESGIVHRDIKPENILVDKKGRVKIADFGLAKILGRAVDPTRLTGAHQVMGTAHYMAPEQLERPLEVDHRADIYSLGVVFYEVLTGELPIGRFQPPSRKIQVDVRVDDVVLKTLEKEPQLRYQYVGELKTDVDGIKGSVGSAPSAAGAAPARPAGALRSWLPWVVTAVVVLALVGMTMVFLVLGRLLGVGTAMDSVTDRNRPAEIATVGEASAGAGKKTSEAGADVQASATPPLIIAAARGNLPIVTSLLDAGADVNAVDRRGTTALSEAVDGGHAEIARMLLDRGADANAARATGVTSLMIAAARGNQTLVEMLLGVGGDVNASDQRGWTALSGAVDGGHDEIARLLLGRDADANVARGTGVTPLMIAAARGNLAVVKMLADAGADVNASNKKGWTALSGAVDRGHVEITRLLLDRGADVNVARGTGVTSLMIAAARGNRALVEMLLKAGADVKAVDARGTTALSEAVDGGHQEIVELLLAADAG